MWMARSPRVRHTGRWASRWVAGIAASGTLAGWCRVAAAEPASAPAAEPGVHTHDGFYLRFASGFGVYDEFAKSETAEHYGGRVSARARGFAVANEFALGGTPYPGLVIGGGVYGIEVVTSSVTTNRDDDPEIVDLSEETQLESRDLIMFAAFADRYFVPTLGLHLQAALGIAQQTAFTIDGGAKRNEKLYIPWGPGLMLGIGYEMWLTEQWSLGVLARVSATVLFGEDAKQVQWVHYAWSWPSFLMTVTYH